MPEVVERERPTAVLLHQPGEGMGRRVPVMRPTVLSRPHPSTPARMVESPPGELCGDSRRHRGRRGRTSPTSVPSAHIRAPSAAASGRRRRRCPPPAAGTVLIPAALSPAAQIHRTRRETVVEPGGDGAHPVRRHRQRAVHRREIRPAGHRVQVEAVVLADRGGQPAVSRRRTVGPKAVQRDPCMTRSRFRPQPVRRLRRWWHRILRRKTDDLALPAPRSPDH